MMIRPLHERILTQRLDEPDASHHPDVVADIRDLRARLSAELLRHVNDPYRNR